MQRVLRVLATTVALSLIACAGAQADVVHRASYSTTGAGSTVTLHNVTVAPGADRLLTVGVSSSDFVTITGVSYDGQALTGVIDQGGSGARAALWTLVNPPVDTADVVVTFSAPTPAIVGASTFTGVDPIDPIIAATGAHGDDTSNAAAEDFNDTTVADGMVGVLALGNSNNTSNITTGQSIDLVTADLRWNATAPAGLHGAGATRIGNTGDNFATSTGIEFRWFNTTQELNPHAYVTAALRSIAAAVVPTMGTISSSGVGTTGATLGGVVSSDGGGALTERGVVVCQSPCTPTVGAAGSTAFADPGTAVGSYAVAAAGLADGKAYTFRAYATNRVGTGYSASGSFTTTKINLAPTASAGGPYAIDEGASLHLDASGSSDPEGDALTYSWDVDGDGAYDDATGVSPTVTAAQLAALGLADGPDSSNVRVQVSDSGHPAVTSAATTLSIADVAPTATLNTPGAVAEGDHPTVSFSGASDPSSADTTAGFRYAFDLDGNGTWDVGDGTYAGGSTTASATVPIDDDGTYPVKAVIIDKDGGTTEYTTSVVVSNAPPTATLGNDGPVAEGGHPTVSFTDATDPSPADVAAGLHYAFDTDGDGAYDVGDGTYAGSSTTASAPVSIDDDGTYPVKGVVIDKDGGTTEYTTSIVVSNAPPTAKLGNDGPVVEGSDATVSFVDGSDPSPADVAAGLHYAFDLDGDGTYDVGDGTYAGSPSDADATLPTDDDGTFPVKAVVIDKDGGETEYTTSVVVTNAPPTVAVAGAATVQVDTSLAVTLDATDPSSKDAAGDFTYTIAWGDGQSDTVTGPAHATASHSYATAGDHTISVVATDKDGGDSTASTLGVNVTALPALPALPAPPTADVGQTPPAGAPVGGASTTPKIAHITSLSVAPRCVRGTAATTRSVSIRYRLDLAAKVRVSLQRSKGSHAVGKCPPVHGTKQDDGHLKAGTYTSVSDKQVTSSPSGGSLVIAKGSAHGAVGTAARVSPIAMLAKGKRLSPGTYLLTLTTLDASGRTQATARVKFWVLKG